MIDEPVLGSLVLSLECPDGLNTIQTVTRRKVRISYDLHVEGRAC